MPFTRNIPSQISHRAGRDQVFVNGAMQVEARWPNINVHPATVNRSYYSTALTGGNTQPYTSTSDGKQVTAKYTHNNLPNNMVGALVHFIPGSFWWPATGKITAQSGEEITFEYEYEHGTEYAPHQGDLFYLWGKYELMDTPGEWFRKDDGTLYIYTQTGYSPTNHLVEVKAREDIFNLDGKAYITIKNVKITGGRIRTTYLSRNVIIDGIDATYTAHYSIVPGWWADNSLAGISLKGEKSIITNSHLGYTIDAGIELRGSNSKAYNNVVHDAGYLDMSGQLITCEGHQVEIKNNTVWGAGDANAIDYRFSTDSKILYNDAAESGRGTIDGGLLMATKIRDGKNTPFDAKNTEIAYNYIHDGGGNSGGKFFGTSGIYFEDRIDNYVVHHNVTWNTGIGINLPGDGKEGSHNRNIKIYNNTFYNVSVVLGIAPHDLSGTQFCNNVINNFEHNIGLLKEPRPMIENNATVTQDYSHPFFNMSPTNIHAPDVKNGVPIPKYTDPDNRNFIPITNSPLIDKGRHNAIFTSGHVGTNPDIGAFERGKPAFIAGALARPQDVANITVTYDNTAFPGKKFTVSGLPIGRKIDSNWKLQIGTATPGGDMQYNYTTNQATFINVPTENLKGDQEIFLYMGTQGAYKTKSNINLGTPLSVYNIAVYPNPSKGEFFIRIPQEYQDKEVTIRVYSLDGKLVLDKSWTIIMQML